MTHTSVRRAIFLHAIGLYAQRRADAAVDRRGLLRYPTGRADVASVVHGFVLQPALFTVSPAEERRIRQAFGDAPLEPELGDSPNSTVPQRQDIIKSLVVAAVALGRAYSATTPEPKV